MLTKPILLLAFFASVGSLAEAQVKPHPVTVPKVFTGTYAGTTNAYPFARTYGYFQTWYRGDSLKAPRPIFSLGWRAAKGVTVPAQKLKMSIILSSSSSTFSGLSKTFATNHGKDRTVFYTLKTLNLPAQTSPSDPDLPAIWIKGDIPFIFKGPNLVVDVDLQETTAATSTQYRSDAYTASGNKFLSVEKSCGNGNLTGSYAGSTLTFQLLGAPPKTPALFLISTRNQKLAGAIKLPFDLSHLGMTGCVLGIDPIMLISTLTDTSGAAKLSGVLPLGGDTAMLFAQAIHATKSNPTGFATTNVINSLLGTVGLSTYLYCWTAVGPTATSGPYATNRGPIIMFLP